METHPFCQGLQKILCDTTAFLFVQYHINSLGKTEEWEKDKAEVLAAEVHVAWEDLYIL